MTVLLRFVSLSLPFRLLECLLFSQLLEILLSTLTTLNQSDFKETANCFPQPYTTIVDSDATTSKLYDLPSVLVPPEVIELDSMSAESGEESQVKKDEWPEFFVRLFPDDVSVPCTLRTSFLFSVSRSLLTPKARPDTSSARLSWTYWKYLK